MVDPSTATNLVSQMTAVSQQFLGFAPAGSYYFYNNAVWIVTSQIDQATGQLVLQAVNGGGTTLLNTISMLYPSAVAPAAAPAVAAATTSGLQTLLSAAPLATSLPSLITSVKGKAGAAGPNGPTTYQVASGSGPGGSNSFGAAMQIGPDGTSALFQTAQQNFDNVKNNISQNFLGGIPYDPNNAAGLLDQVKAAAQAQYDSLVKAFNTTITNSTNNINTESINLGSVDVAPSQYTADMATDQSSIYSAESGLKNLEQQGPGAYVDNILQKYNAAIGQMTQAQTNLQQAQAYSDAIQQSLNSIASKGEIQLAITQLQKQGVTLNLQADGTTPADFATERAMDQQIMTDEKNYLSNYTPDQVEQMKSDFAAYQKDGAATQASTIEKQLEKTAGIKMGIELAVAAGTAYAEESAISSMFSNGFSGKELATTIGTGLGLYISLHLVHGLLTNGSPGMQFLWDHIPNIFGKDLGGFIGSSLKFLTSGWGFLAIQGLLVLLAYLFRTPPEETAAETLNAEVNPVVWNPSGQVIFLTAGLTMASMGINLSPSAPMMQTMTMSQAQATQALQGLGASSVPTDNTRYADVFVQQGAAGQPTRVIYLTADGTDSKGNILETVTERTLNSSFQFATSQPPTGYIPFFIPGSNGSVTPNPQVVQSLSAQQHLLQCADGTWVTTAQACANGAAVTSHSSGN